MKLGNIKQTPSPFLKQEKSWDEEVFKLTPELKKGIIEELNFSKPSVIQAAAIPLICNRAEFKPEEEKNQQSYKNLIARSKNGSGKTGAFAIGSVLRVNDKVKKPQVICLAHVRELAN